MLVGCISGVFFHIKPQLWQFHREQINVVLIPLELLSAACHRISQKNKRSLKKDCLGSVCTAALSWPDLEGVLVDPTVSR